MADQRTYQRVICEVDGDGNGRVVYPRNSGFRICAAGDTCATQTEVQALANDLCGAVDRIETRLAALEAGEVLPADVLEFLRNVAHGPCASADLGRAWSLTSNQASALLRKYQASESESDSAPDLMAAYMLGRYDSAQKPTLTEKQHYRRGWLDGTKANQEMQARLDQTAWDAQAAELDALRGEVKYLRALDEAKLKTIDTLLDEVESLRKFKNRVGIYSPWRWDDEMAEYQCERCGAVMPENNDGALHLEAYAHLHKPTCSWYQPKETNNG